VRALRKENPNKENPHEPATGGTISIVALVTTLGVKARLAGILVC
jgi:hypothetical protein